MFRCDGCATIGCLLLFHTVHGSYDKVPASMGPCIARARASASPPGGTSLLARASRAPSRPKRSEQIAGRARAPPTELRRPAPPRWEAPANYCRRPSRSTFTARAQSRLPASAASAVGAFRADHALRMTSSDISGFYTLRPPVLLNISFPVVVGTAQPNPPLFPQPSL